MKQITKTKISPFVSIIVIIAVIAVAITATIFINNYTKDSNLIKEFSPCDKVGINITYFHDIETYKNTFTKVIMGSSVSEKENGDAKITVGFADTYLLDQYVSQMEYASLQDFLKDNGYLTLYYNFKGTHYYLLRNTTTLPYSWNLLIASKNDFKFVQLSTIDPQKIESAYAKKVEYFDGAIRFYLGCGIYSVDSKGNVDVTEINLDNAFRNIYEETKFNLLASRIEFYNNTFYVLATDETNRSYLIKYDTISCECKTFQLQYLAQDIVIHKNNICVLSMNNDKIYLETFDYLSDTIKVREFEAINKLKLGKLSKRSLWSSLSYDGSLFFTFSTDIESDVKSTYLFNIDTNNFDILSANSYSMTDRNFNIYGLYFYIL